MPESQDIGPTKCICVPCTTPAYGLPGYDHCAACCGRTLIAEYDHDCPVEEHRELAELQFGPKGQPMPESNIGSATNRCGVCGSTEHEACESCRSGWQSGHLCGSCGGRGFVCLVGEGKADA